MKKLVLAMLVVALAAPALADVAITTADLGDGLLEVTVTPSGDAVVRGLALLLTTTSGDAVLAEVADVTATGFNTFIDYANDVGAAYVVGEGHPVANADGPGVAFNGSAFVLSAGYLDETGAKGGLPAAAVFTVQYDLTAASEITITACPLRSGVGNDTGLVGDTLGTVTTLPIVQALEVGGTVCLGDIDGDGARTPADLNMMIGTLSAAGAPFVVPNTNPAYSVAADMDADGAVTPADLNMLIGTLSAVGAPFVSPCP